MPFRRSNRGSSLRPINRIKHVVDRQSAVAAGTGESTFLVNTTDTPQLSDSDGNETGSRVNALYLHLEAVATSSGALSNFYMYVAKNPGANLTLPEANVVGISDNKKYVFHQEMIMFQKQTGSNPRTVFNGVIMIPKLYRRNGPKDQIILEVLAPGVSADYCFQCHYKEFR